VIVFVEITVHASFSRHSASSFRPDIARSEPALNAPYSPRRVTDDPGLIGQVGLAGTGANGDLTAAAIFGTSVEPIAISANRT
tara:strand:- start:42 stop:290 length:249 start_codon:yes stop_codon:yes gene_type:complete